ncbi:hypothetical protein ACYSNW_04715 [Enterococcus sp. LJL99]
MSVNIRDSIDEKIEQMSLGELKRIVRECYFNTRVRNFRTAYRKSLEKTIEDVSIETGVSVDTIARFEMLDYESISRKDFFILKKYYDDLPEEDDVSYQVIGKEVVECSND